MRPFVETDEPFQSRVLEINLGGPIRVARAVLPDMIEAGFGRIVLIASDAARVGSSGEAIYAAAKGGLLALAKSIAREVVRHGITANCVCPGPTDTPLFRGLAEATEDGDRITEALTRAIPMRRLGRPDDVAPAVAFLASDAAAYITGQTLSVSGGLTMA
jgi:2-hydroxycyclohexanecarboxyl-CoA dehydrogenase